MNNKSLNGFIRDFARASAPVAKAAPRNTRKKINQEFRIANMSDEDRILVESGILTELGSTTPLGRRIICDTMLQNREFKAALVDVAATTL